MDDLQVLISAVLGDDSKRSLDTELGALVDALSKKHKVQLDVELSGEFAQTVETQVRDGAKKVSRAVKKEKQAGGDVAAEIFDVDELEAQGRRYFSGTHDLVARIQREFKKLGRVNVENVFKDADGEIQKFTASVTRADNVIEKFNFKAAQLQDTFGDMQGFVQDSSALTNKNAGSELEKTLDYLSKKKTDLANYTSSILKSSSSPLKEGTKEYDAYIAELNKVLEHINKVSVAHETLSSKQKRNITEMVSYLKRYGAELQAQAKANGKIAAPVEEIFDTDALQQAGRNYFVGVNDIVARVKSEFGKIGDVNVSNVFKDTDGNIQSFSASVSKANGVVEKLNFELAKLRNQQGVSAGFIQKSSSLSDKNSGAELQNTLNYLNRLKIDLSNYTNSVLRTSANPLEQGTSQYDAYMVKLREVLTGIKHLHAANESLSSASRRQIDSMVADLKRYGKELQLSVQQEKRAIPSDPIFDIAEMDKAGREYFAGVDNIVERAKKRFSELGSVDITNVLQDADGNIQKFSASVTKADGVVERFNFELAKLKNAAGELKGFVHKNSVVTDKNAGAELQKTLNYLSRIDSKISDITSKTLVNTAKPLLGDMSQYTDYQSKLNAVKARIAEIKEANATLSTEHKREIDSMVADLRRYAKELQTSAYAATDLSAATFADKKVELQAALETDIRKWQNAGLFGPDFEVSIRKAKKLLDEATDPTGLDKYRHELALLNNQFKGMKLDSAATGKIFNADRLNADIQTAQLRIQNLKKTYSAFLSDPTLRQQWDKLFDASKTIESKQALQELNAQTRKFEQSLISAGKHSRSMMDELKANAEKMGSWMLLGASIAAIMRGITGTYDAVVKLDSAMTELKKVTNETKESYDVFLDSAARRSVEIGTSYAELVESTATFARLGYGLVDAQKLAEAANIYAVVGDEIDSVETATNSIISTMKGFGIEAEDAMSIVDKFNEVGNKFAISSGGIGDALARSASALSEANNSIDESIGLIVAANNVVQDPRMVGTMWKTVSMRIRGVKTELKEAGLDAELMAESTSKLRNTIKAMTNVDGTGGFDIMADEDTLKSTFDIMVGISKVYDKMTDKNQAAMVEMLGGKRQGNALAAAIKNIGDATKAREAAFRSEGSAMEEHEKWMDSIVAKQQIFAAQYEAFSKVFLNSDLIKGTFDVGTGLLGWLTEVIDKVGALPVVFAALSPFVNKIQAFALDENKNFAGSGFGISFKSSMRKAELAQDVALLDKYNSRVVALGNSAGDLTQKQIIWNDTIGHGSDLLKNNIKVSDTAVVSSKGYAAAQTAAGNAVAATGAKAKIASTGVRLLNGALNMAFGIAVGIGINFLLSGITKLVNKGKEAREEAITSGSVASDNATKVYDLATSYIELSKAVESGSGSEEELKRIQNELIDQLGTHAGSVDMLSDSYEGLRKSIVDAARAQMTTDISKGAAAAQASKEKATKKLTGLFGGSVGSLISASGDGAKDAFDFLESAGFTGITVGNQSGSLSLPYKTNVGPLKSVSFKKLLKNQKYLENAMNTVREKFGASNPVFKALSDAYTEYSESLSEAVKHIDNTNRMVAQEAMLAAEQVEQPQSLAEFKNFRTRILENVKENLSFDTSGTESVEEAVDSALRSVSKYSDMLDRLNKLSQEADIGDKTIPPKAERIKTALNDLWSHEDFKDTKKDLLAFANSLDSVPVQDIVTLVKESEALQPILEEDGITAEFLANVLMDIATGGDGLSLITEEMLGLNDALTGMQGSFDGVVDAKARYETALNVEEKDEGFKAYAEAFKVLNEEFEEGTTNSNKFWAAAEFMFGSEQLAIWGWRDGLDEIYKAMQDNKSVFEDADSAGAGFIERLYKMSKAGKLVNDQGEKLIDISKDATGAFAFDVDPDNIEDIAKKLGMTEEAALACFKALSMWGNIDFFDIAEVSEAIEKLGISTEEAGTKVINVERLTEALMTLGKTDIEIADVLSALGELDKTELFYATGNVDTLTDSLKDLKLATQDGVTLKVNYEGLGDLLSKLGYTKEEAKDLIQKLEDADNVSLANVDGQVKNVSDALEYIDSIQFTEVTSSVNGVEEAIDDVNTSSTDDVTSEIDGVGTAADRATQKVYSIGSAVDSIDGKSATVYYNVKRRGGLLGALFGFAKGTKDAPAGPALVGEEAPELIQTEDGAYLAGQNGPEIVNLNRGDQVYPGGVTRKILHTSGRKLTGIIPTYAKGRISTGGLYVGTNKKKNEDKQSSRKEKQKKEVEVKAKVDKNSLKESAKDPLEELSKAVANILGDFEHEIFIKEKNGGTPQQVIAIYRKMQQAVHVQAEKMRKAGAKANNDYLQEMGEKWFEYEETIKDILHGIYETSVEEYQTILNQLQSQYDVFENRGLNDKMTSSLKKQVDLQKKIQEAAHAEANRLRASGVDENDKMLKECGNAWWQAEAEIQNINSKIAENTLSTFDDFIAYADNFELWGNLDITRVDYLRQKLEEINKLYRQGILNRKEYEELSHDTTLEIYTSQKDALTEIIEKTEELIRQEAEDKVEALEKQIDDYRKIINLKKESLSKSREESAYQDEVDDKVAAIAEKQAKLAQLNRDTSREANAEKQRLLKEIADLQKDLSDYQADHAFNAQMDALDKEEKAHESAKNHEIDQVQSSIDTEEKLYQEAIKRIDSDWDQLYQDLLEWNRQYGDMIDGESSITSAWKSAKAAAEEYGGVVSALGSINSGNQVQQIVGQMAANGKAYGAASAEEKQRLGEENIRLGASLSHYGVNAVRGPDGIWYVDRVGGEKLFDKYKAFTYHTGGIVGQSPFGSNEVPAVLEKGELVLTQTQYSGFLDRMKQSVTGVLDMILSGIANAIPDVGMVAQSVTNVAEDTGDINIYNTFSVPAGMDTDDLANKYADATIGKLMSAARRKGVRPSVGAHILR